MTVFISRYHWKVESCHFFLRGWGTGGLSGPGVRVGPGSGVSVNASLDVTKLSVTLMSLPGILQKNIFNGSEVRSRILRKISFIFFVSND